MKTTCLVAFLLILASGCSNRGFYESTQVGMRNECSRISASAEYDSCIEQASKPYDEYERERKEVMNQ